MKNTTTSLGLAFLLSTVAVIVVFVQAETANSKSGDVLAAERACAKAWVDADIATLDRFIADDYVEMIAEPGESGPNRAILAWFGFSSGPQHPHSLGMLRQSLASPSMRSSRS